MREITIQVYKFEELSEEAKNKARNWWRESGDDDWSDYETSLKAISEHMDARYDYAVSAYGYSHVDIKVNLDSDVEELSGVRALTWVWNNWISPTLKGKYYGKFVPCEKSEEHPNGMEHKKYYSKATQKFDCNFTGMAMDMNFWEAWEYAKNEVRAGNFFDVMDFVKELESRFCKEWVQEMEYRNSDEYIDEEICCNEYEFYEDGSVY